MYKEIGQRIAEIDSANKLTPEFIDLLMATYINASSERLRMTQDLSVAEALISTRELFCDHIDGMIQRQGK